MIQTKPIIYQEGGLTVFAPQGPNPNAGFAPNAVFGQARQQRPLQVRPLNVSPFLQAEQLRVSQERTQALREQGMLKFTQDVLKNMLDSSVSATDPSTGLDLRYEWQRDLFTNVVADKQQLQKGMFDLLAQANRPGGKLDFTAMEDLIRKGGRTVNSADYQRALQVNKQGKEVLSAALQAAKDKGNIINWNEVEEYNKSLSRIAAGEEGPAPTLGNLFYNKKEVKDTITKAIEKIKEGSTKELMEIFGDNEGLLATLRVIDKGDVEQWKKVISAYLLSDPGVQALKDHEGIEDAAEFSKRFIDPKVDLIFKGIGADSEGDVTKLEAIPGMKYAVTPDGRNVPVGEFRITEDGNVFKIGTEKDSGGGSSGNLKDFEKTFGIKSHVIDALVDEQVDITNPSVVRAIRDFYHGPNSEDAEVDKLPSQEIINEWKELSNTSSPTSGAPGTAPANTPTPRKYGTTGGVDYNIIEEFESTSGTNNINPDDEGQTSVSPVQLRGDMFNTYAEEFFKDLGINNPFPDAKDTNNSEEIARVYAETVENFPEFEEKAREFASREIHAPFIKKFVSEGVLMHEGANTIAAYIGSRTSTKTRNEIFDKVKEEYKNNPQISKDNPDDFYPAMRGAIEGMVEEGKLDSEVLEKLDLVEDRVNDARYNYGIDFKFKANQRDNKIISASEFTKDALRNLQTAIANPEVTGGYQMDPNKLTISSIHRTPRENRIFGGTPNSYHLTGSAFDVRTSGVEGRKFQRFVNSEEGKNYFRENNMRAVDEGDHIHVEPLGGIEVQATQVDSLPQAGEQALAEPTQATAQEEPQDEQSLKRRKDQQGYQRLFGIEEDSVQVLPEIQDSTAPPLNESVVTEATNPIIEKAVNDGKVFMEKYLASPNPGVDVPTTTKIQEVYDEIGYNGGVFNDELSGLEVSLIQEGKNSGKYRVFTSRDNETRIMDNDELEEFLLQFYQ